MFLRRAAFDAVGGFDEEFFLYGEETDLCLRLRRRGHRIVRIDAEMTLHDANITRFSQWWRRTERSGYAYADGFLLHRLEGGRYSAKQVRSNFFWGALVPALILGLSAASPALAAALSLGYPVLAARVYAAARKRFSQREAFLFAIFVTLGKLPSAIGQFRCLGRHLRGRRGSLIEYKSPG